jgi:hypothetical protein
VASRGSSISIKVYKGFQQPTVIAVFLQSRAQQIVQGNLGGHRSPTLQAAQSGRCAMLLVERLQRSQSAMPSTYSSCQSAGSSTNPTMAACTTQSDCVTIDLCELVYG